MRKHLFDSQIELCPCDEKGKNYTEADDVFVDKPEDLVGKKLHFNVTIKSIVGLPNKYVDVQCKYKIYDDKEDTTTSKSNHQSNPEVEHTKMYTFNPVTPTLVEYLDKESFVVRVEGKQHVRRSAVASRKKQTTKELLRSDRGAFSKTANLMNGFQLNGRNVDPQKQSIIVELLLLKKTQARLQQKCVRTRRPT